MRTIDALVFIGRFQPFHAGHLAVVRHALSQSDRVLLPCGSARQPRSTRNPWTFDQVVAMVRACLTARSPPGSPWHRSWTTSTTRPNGSAWSASVTDLLPPRGPDQGAVRLGLIGLASSGTNYFPSRFPQWPAFPFRPDSGVRSTPIREALSGWAGRRSSGWDYLESDAAQAVLPRAGAPSPARLLRRTGLPGT